MVMQEDGARGYCHSPKWAVGADALLHTSSVRIRDLYMKHQSMCGECLISKD